MHRLAKYQITEQLYESGHTLVYRARRKTDQSPVILKVLKDSASSDELIRYRHEYASTRNLDLPGVILIYTQEKDRNILLMEAEDFGGRDLDWWLGQQRVSVAIGLQLAIRLTEILGRLHAAQYLRIYSYRHFFAIPTALGFVEILGKRGL